MRQHNERCKECKTRVKDLLETIFEKVEVNYNMNIPCRINNIRENEHKESLILIYNLLQEARGNRKFVNAYKLPRVDFYIPNPGIIIEFDESQHFTTLRKIALENYPDNIELGFEKSKWIDLCKKLDKKDNNPIYRDEQRAWFDTLRDFTPFMININPTIRLFSKDFNWCTLEPQENNDINLFKKFLNYA